MGTLKSLTIFFPSLNDAKILPYLVCKADEVASKVANNHEIIVINDGSTDDSRQVLESLSKHYPKLRVVNHSKNLGYGGALKSGFKHATKDWIFYTDGDGQYDINELLNLVKALKTDIDLVNGYKLKRADNWLRKMAGDIYNLAIHRSLKLPIRDLDCDFRLMRRSVLEKIDLKSNSGAICAELIGKLNKVGATFAEVPVHHYPRKFGKSQFFTVRNLLRSLIDIVVMSS